MGKGAYSMEDDWSSGFSGYSFDIPLVLIALAQEAAGEWKVAKNKKSTKPAKPAGKNPAWCGATGTGACTTCPCYINKGRYGVLLDTSYDIDYDLSIMMISLEEGDVPP